MTAIPIPFANGLMVERGRVFRPGPLPAWPGDLLEPKPRADVPYRVKEGLDAPTSITPEDSMAIRKALDRRTFDFGRA